MILQACGYVIYNPPMAQQVQRNPTHPWTDEELHDKVSPCLLLSLHL